MVNEFAPRERNGRTFELSGHGSQPALAAGAQAIAVVVRPEFPPAHAALLNAGIDMRRGLGSFGLFFQCPNAAGIGRTDKGHLQAEIVRYNAQLLACFNAHESFPHRGHRAFGRILAGGGLAFGGGRICAIRHWRGLWFGRRFGFELDRRRRSLGALNEFP
ncbi:MAG TPA: hypothetical protein PLI13_00895, partial [Paracoccus sp. (in: a-proteobacteria)]|nr:hypothetical protein [Paracoccus sp. (in: a-proteobacteria)]